MWKPLCGNAALWDEVKDRLKKSALGLSGGQQQRLCIARALAVEPDIILMDEPTSALDPISTLKIEDLMGDLREKYTVIIVTHNMQQAARIADQTAFFLTGEIVEFAERKPCLTIQRTSALSAILQAASVNFDFASEKKLTDRGSRLKEDIWHDKKII